MPHVCLPDLAEIIYLLFITLSDKFPPSVVFINSRAYGPHLLFIEESELNTTSSSQQLKGIFFGGTSMLLILI